jgi:hypothetical protein
MPESQYSIYASISVGEMNSSFVTWNSSTTLNSTALLVNNDISYNTLNISLSQTTTITGGVVTFQGSFDGVNFFNLVGVNPGTQAVVGPTYTLQASTYAIFQFNLTAIPYFQVLLSTAITGTGAVTIGYAADSFVSSNVVVSGTVAVTQSTSPWVTDVTQWANTALGAPSAYGTSPGAVTVMGVNAFITNVPAVSQSGTWTVQQGTPPWVVDGNLTNNNAAPTATLQGVLPAIAETAYTTVTYTTGDMVLPVTDLHGALNQDLQAIGGTAVRSNQTTTAAGVLDNNLVGIAGTTVVTAAAGVQKVGIVGNAAGVLDAVTGAAVPANAIQVGASDGTDLQPLSISVKGTQGARGLSTQDLKDSGRTYLSFTLDAGAAPATEALSTMAINKGGTTSSATTYAVTAGKTLRLQSITIGFESNSGTQTFKIRIRSAATVLATSPIVWAGMTGGASGNFVNLFADWPDGIEIAGGQEMGVSLDSSNATNTTTYSLNGYEY